MDKRFYAECEFVDGDSYFKCNYNIYSPNKNKQINNIIINITPDLRSDREIDKITFIGYCSRGYIPIYDKIINKIQFESYITVCKKN